MNKASRFAVVLLLTAMGISPVSAAEEANPAQSQSLPCVLLIGDSICGGYQRRVKQLLASKAVVVKQEGNAQHTGT